MRAFFFVLRASEDDFVFDVALHLPDVAGMRFKNIDNQEGDFAVVVVVELVEGGNLPPEGRSSVAAEDEDDGRVSRERGELHAIGFVEFEEREVWGAIAGAEFAGALVRPERFEGERQEDGRAGHARHDAREGFRGLAHCPDDIAGVRGVENNEDCEAADRPLLFCCTDPHGAGMVAQSGVRGSSGFRLGLVASRSSSVVSENSRWSFGTALELGGRGIPP